MSDYDEYEKEEKAEDKKEFTEQLMASDNDKSTPALIEKFVIRLPNGLRKKIKHLSEQNRRSMNSEIIMVLEKHIQQHLMDYANELSDLPLSMDTLEVTSGAQPPASSELNKRLENLPEEKKQALLDLLG